MQDVADDLQFWTNLGNPPGAANPGDTVAIQAAWIVFFRKRYRAKGVYNSADLEDLAQEAIAEVWRCRDTIMTKTSPRDYAAGFAKNVLGKFYREAGRNLPANPTADPPDPRINLEGQVVAESIRKAFNKLSAGERQILKAFKLDGLLWKEVAGKLGRSETALRQESSRLQRRLKRSPAWRNLR